MNVLVTGLHGTVAPALVRALQAAGHAILGWDRATVPTDDAGAIARFLDREQPHWFFHVATGSPDWAEQIARACAERHIRFLFTSSVCVYSAAQRGPFPPATLPAPDDDYGRYKLECERRVQAAHPGAVVARLGWQIGTAPGGNHMVDFLERTHRERGAIEASRRWIPACSFLDDTAQGLVQALQEIPSGVVHLEGNPGLDFHAIACALNQRHGGRWRIVPVDVPDWDQRLLDGRIPLRPISDSLA